MKFKLVSMITWLSLAFCNQIVAQKTIILENRNSTEREKNYNLSGCELYIYTVNGYEFVPKLSAFTFLTTPKIDSLIANDTSSHVILKIRTSKFDYGVSIIKKYFLKYDMFSIEIQKMKEGLYYVVTIMPPRGENITYTPWLVDVEPNKLWKNKYNSKKK